MNLCLIYEIKHEKYQLIIYHQLCLFFVKFALTLNFRNLL
jgi:hypothetical protein